MLQGRGLPVGSVVWRILTQQYEGTLERFTGDSLTVFFKHPVFVADPAERAVRMALAMQEAGNALGRDWHRRGIDLGLAIGFERRLDYGAIGTVTNLAARLCAEAGSGQVLTNRKTLATVEHLVEAEEIGEIPLKGFSRPVAAARIAALKAS